MSANQTRGVYPTDLNDTQWNVIAPLLPPPSNTGRPRVHQLREVLNAIFYVVKNGGEWRALPHDFPPWQSIYHYFRLWRIDGTWERLNTELHQALRQRRGRHKQPSAAIIDSQSVKTVEGGPQRGYDAGKLVWGRKRHLIVDTLGLVMRVLVTSAGVQDRDGAKLLLGGLFDRIKKVRQSEGWREWPYCRLRLIWADGSYRGDLIEWVKRELGWELSIVEKAPHQQGFVVLPRRWVVERTLAWLSRHRRLSRDYEHLPKTGEAFIYVAMIRLMIRNLAHG